MVALDALRDFSSRLIFETGMNFRFDILLMKDIFQVNGINTDGKRTVKKGLLSFFMPTGLKSFMMGNIKEDYCKHVLISRGGISNEVFQT